MSLGFLGTSREFLAYSRKIKNYRRDKKIIHVGHGQDQNDSNPKRRFRALDDNAVERKLIAQREFRIRPNTAQAIHAFRSSGYPFSGYGLDVTLNGGDDSRSGCGSYIGLMTEHSGLAGTDGWTVGQGNGELFMPVIRLNISYSWAGLGSSYNQYKNGNSGTLRSAFEDFRDTATNILQRPRNVALAAAWGQGPPVADQLQGLNFFDPSRIMDWIDGQNEQTHWKQTELDYKDRGVEVRYDIPETKDLSQWRNRPLWRH